MVIGLSANIPAFGYAYLGTSGGGAQSFNELWVQGLVTTAKDRPVPEARLAAELPSLDRGTAQVTPDGKMRATWKLRPDAKWADGTDLTSRDFAFGLEMMKDPQNPMGGATLVVNIGPLVESIEVLDDKTFVMNWVRPFYQFDAVGTFALQPIPTHVLRTVWDERNMEAVLNHPYWRGDFFQVGPYRPSKFDPQTEIELTAVPQYFLGRPKIDTITLKVYGDSTVLYPAVLAGTIDVTSDNSLRADQAIELKERWGRAGGGKVFIGYGTTRGIFPMFNRTYQPEAAMLDPHVRQALFYAVDREAWASSLLAGYVQNTAYGMLPEAHALYDSTRDTLRDYRFDTAKALQLLGELGWARGADGLLVNASDGRRFKQEIWTTQDNEPEVSILGDMWKQVGIDSVQFIIPTAQQDNRELRQSFPGVEISARGYGEHILTRLECNQVPASPRFNGANRGHYCTQRMDDLIGVYRGSVTRPEQGKAIGDIARFMAQELPAMELYFNLSNPTVIAGLNVLADDWGGGIQASGYYGSYFRNGHTWEWAS